MGEKKKRRKVLSQIYLENQMERHIKLAVRMEGGKHLLAT